MPYGMKAKSTLLPDTLQRTCRIFREVREATGLSQIDFSQRLNMSQAQVSKIENEQIAPSLVTWVNFCATFEISFDSLHSAASAHLAIEKFRKVAYKFVNPEAGGASQFKNKKID